MKNSTKERIGNIMSIIFQVEMSELDDSCAYGDFEPWDSLAHMNLITAIEEEFMINISDDDVTDMLNISLVYDIVNSYLE